MNVADNQMVQSTDWLSITHTEAQSRNVPTNKMHASMVWMLKVGFSKHRRKVD